MLVHACLSGNYESIILRKLFTISEIHAKVTTM